MNSRLHFSFQQFDARGAAVRLESAWQQVQLRNPLPQSVKQLLGESLAAVSLMIGNLKVDGRLSLQIQGGSMLSLLLAECDSNGDVRAIAHCDNAVTDQTTFAELLTGASMVITISPDQGQQYQGIVAIDVNGLAASLEGYFRQSEQLDSKLWLAADHQHAAGLLLQKMPQQLQTEDIDGWDRIGILGETLTSEELLALDSEQVIRRLFHRELLSGGQSNALRFGCSCSRERVIGMLAMLGRDEVVGALEDDALSVRCEFCNEDYRFDRVDLEQVFIQTTTSGPATLQ